MASERSQNVAHCVEGIGVIGPELQRLIVARERILQSSRIALDVSEIGAGFGRSRVDTQRLADQPGDAEGRFVVAEAPEDLIDRQ